MRTTPNNMTIADYDDAIRLMTGRPFQVWEGGSLSVAEDWTNAHILRGNQHRAAGRYKEALADYEAAGKISIKGLSQDVRIPFTVQSAGATSTFEGGFTLLRLQFKVGEGVWADTDTVANEVQVRFKLVASGRT